MHRQPLLHLLNRYLVTCPQEADSVARMRRFVESNPDCFERSLTIGHVTGSAWLLDRTGTRVLLTHHRKIDRWMQLGGHADGERDLLVVARREAVEESGIAEITPCHAELFDIDIHEIAERGTEAAHLHYDCRFLLQATGDQRYRVSDESHDLRWVEIDRVDQFTDEESVLRMVGKCRAPGANQS